MRKRLKICMISSSFPRSKSDNIAGKSVALLTKELAKRADVDVVAPHDAGARMLETLDGARVHRFRYGPENLQKVAYGSGMPDNLRNSWIARLQLPVFFACFLRKSLAVCKKCDIVHINHMIFLAPLIKFITGKPVVITVRGEELRMAPKPLVRMTLSSADAIISPHPELTDIVKSLGYGHKLTEIQNIIEFKKPNMKSVSEFRKKFGLGDQPVVTFVGRFVDFKDPLTFVEAIPSVLEKTKNVKFLLVGDGVLNEQVEKRVSELGIGRWIVMPGWRDDVAETILPVTDIFAAISPKENVWSMSLLEALKANVPTIVTDSGYSKKVFSHGLDACIVPPKSPKEFASAVSGLLLDEGMRSRLARNAGLLLDRSGFSSSQTTEKTMEVYNKVMEQNA